EKGNLSSEEFDQWEKSVPHLKPVIQSLREKHKGVRNSGFDPELMNHLEEIHQLLNSGGTIQKLTRAYLKESLGEGYEEFQTLLKKYVGSDKKNVKKGPMNFLGYRTLQLMGEMVGVRPMVQDGHGEGSSVGVVSRPAEFSNSGNSGDTNSGDTILNSDEGDQASPSKNNGSDNSQLVLPLWNWVFAGVLRLGGMEKDKAQAKADEVLKKRWVRVGVIPALELLGLPGFAHFLAPVLGVWAIPSGAFIFALIHLIHAPPGSKKEKLKQFAVRFIAATLISSLLPVALASFDPESLSFFDKFAEYFKGSSGQDQFLWGYIGHAIYNVFAPKSYQLVLAKSGSKKEGSSKAQLVLSLDSAWKILGVDGAAQLFPPGALDQLKNLLQKESLFWPGIRFKEIVFEDEPGDFLGADASGRIRLGRGVWVSPLLLRFSLLRGLESLQVDQVLIDRNLDEELHHWLDIRSKNLRKVMELNSPLIIIYNEFKLFYKTNTLCHSTTRTLVVLCRWARLFSELAPTQEEKALLLGQLKDRSLATYLGKSINASSELQILEAFESLPAKVEVPRMIDPKLLFGDLTSLPRPLSPDRYQEILVEPEKYLGVMNNDVGFRDALAKRDSLNLMSMREKGSSFLSSARPEWDQLLCSMDLVLQVEIEERRIPRTSRKMIERLGNLVGEDILRALSQWYGPQYAEFLRQLEKGPAFFEFLETLGSQASQHLLTGGLPALVYEQFSLRPWEFKKGWEILGTLVGPEALQEILLQDPWAVINAVPCFIASKMEQEEDVEEDEGNILEHVIPWIKEFEGLTQSPPGKMVALFRENPVVFVKRMLGLSRFIFPPEKEEGLDVETRRIIGRSLRSLEPSVEEGFGTFDKLFEALDFSEDKDTRGDEGDEWSLGENESAAERRPNPTSLEEATGYQEMYTALSSRLGVETVEAVRVQDPLALIEWMVFLRSEIFSMANFDDLLAVYGRDRLARLGRAEPNFFPRLLILLRNVDPGFLERLSPPIFFDAIARDVGGFVKTWHVWLMHSVPGSQLITRYRQERKSLIEMGLIDLTSTRFEWMEEEDVFNKTFDVFATLFQVLDHLPWISDETLRSLFLEDPQFLNGLILNIFQLDGVSFKILADQGVEVVGKWVEVSGSRVWDRLSDAMTQPVLTELVQNDSHSLVTFLASLNAQGEIFLRGFSFEDDLRMSRVRTGDSFFVALIEAGLELQYLLNPSLIRRGIALAKKVWGAKNFDQHADWFFRIIPVVSQRALVIPHQTRFQGLKVSPALKQGLKSDPEAVAKILEQPQWTDGLYWLTDLLGAQDALNMLASSPNVFLRYVYLTPLEKVVLKDHLQTLSSFFQWNDEDFRRCFTEDPLGFYMLTNHFVTVMSHENKKVEKLFKQWDSQGEVLRILAGKHVTTARLLIESLQDASRDEDMPHFVQEGLLKKAQGEVSGMDSVRRAQMFSQLSLSTGFGVRDVDVLQFWNDFLSRVSLPMDQTDAQVTQAMKEDESLVDRIRIILRTVDPDQPEFGLAMRLLVRMPDVFRVIFEEIPASRQNLLKTHALNACLWNDFDALRCSPSSQWGLNELMMMFLSGLLEARKGVSERQTMEGIPGLRLHLKRERKAWKQGQERTSMASLLTQLNELGINLDGAQSLYRQVEPAFLAHLCVYTLDLLHLSDNLRDGMMSMLEEDELFQGYLMNTLHQGFLRGERTDSSYREALRLVMLNPKVAVKILADDRLRGFTNEQARLLKGDLVNALLENELNRIVASHADLVLGQEAGRGLVSLSSKLGKLPPLTLTMLAQMLFERGLHLSREEIERDLDPVLYHTWYGMILPRLAVLERGYRGSRSLDDESASYVTRVATVAIRYAWKGGEKAKGQGKRVIHEWSFPVLAGEIATIPLEQGKRRTFKLSIAGSKGIEQKDFQLEVREDHLLISLTGESALLENLGLRKGNRSFHLSIEIPLPETIQLVMIPSDTVGVLPSLFQLGRVGDRLYLSKIDRNVALANYFDQSPGDKVYVRKISTEGKPDLEVVRELIRTQVSERMLTNELLVAVDTLQQTQDADEATWAFRTIRSVLNDLGPQGSSKNVEGQDVRFEKPYFDHVFGSLQRIITRLEGEAFTETGLVGPQELKRVQDEITSSSTVEWLRQEKRTLAGTFEESGLRFFLDRYRGPMENRRTVVNHFLEQLRIHPNPARLVRELYEKGDLDYFLHEFTSLRGQGQPSFHRGVNADEHTLRVLEEMDALIASGRFQIHEPVWLRLLALFHDVGKARHGSRGHSRRSIEALEQFLASVDAPEPLIHRLTRLIELHQYLGNIAASEVRRIATPGRQKELKDPKFTARQQERINQLVESLRRDGTQAQALEDLQLLYLLNIADSSAIPFPEGDTGNRYTTLFDERLADVRQRVEDGIRNSDNSQLVLPLWNWVLEGVLRFGGMEENRAKVKVDEVLKKRWVRVGVIPALELFGLPGFARLLALVLGVWAIPAGSFIFALIHLIHAPPQPWQEHLKQFLVRFIAATLISSLLPMTLAFFDSESLSFFEKFAEYFKGSSWWDQVTWGYVGHVVYNMIDFLILFAVKMMESVLSPDPESNKPNENQHSTQQNVKTSHAFSSKFSFVAIRYTLIKKMSPITKGNTLKPPVPTNWPIISDAATILPRLYSALANPLRWFLSKIISPVILKLRVAPLAMLVNVDARATRTLNQLVFARETYELQVFKWVRKILGDMIRVFSTWPSTRSTLGLSDSGDLGVDFFHREATAPFQFSINRFEKLIPSSLNIYSSWIRHFSKDVLVTGTRDRANYNVPTALQEGRGVSRDVFIEQEGGLEGQSITTEKNELSIFQLLGGQVKSSTNMIGRQLRKIFFTDNFLIQNTRLQKLENLPNHNAGSLEAGFSMTNIWIYRNKLIDQVFHLIKSFASLLSHALRGRSSLSGRITQLLRASDGFAGPVDVIAHFDAQNRPDLAYPQEEMAQVNTLLRGNPITITVTNKQFSVPDSDEKKALYRFLGIEADQEQEFLKKWAEFIQARAQDLGFEETTLKNGAYIFYFGDEEHPIEGYGFRSPYGNCVGDGKFFVNLKHFTNIPQEYRIADWIYGTSHEAMHEISGRGDELHRILTPQDVRILRTGQIGGAVLTEAVIQFRKAFLETLAPGPILETEERSSSLQVETAFPFFRFNKPVFHVFEDNVILALQVNPEAFDDLGKSRVFFNRVGNQIYLNGALPSRWGDVGEVRKDMTHLTHEFERAYPEYEVLACLPNGNLGYNDWFVGIVNGKVYRGAFEPIESRVYDMLVIKKDGQTAVMSLTFRNVEGRLCVFEANRNVTDEIQSATYGQRIVKDGQVNVEGILDQFEDLRHLLRLPFFKLDPKKFPGGMLTFGFGDGHGELYQNNKEKAKEAFRGQPVTLDLTPLTDVDISSEERDRIFTQWGYRRVNSAEDLQLGEYAIDEQSHTIRIKFLMGVHPHSVIGRTKEGKIFTAAVHGETHYTGTTISDLAQELIQRGAQDAFLWANGKDAVVQQIQEGKTVEATGARASAVEVLLIVRKLESRNIFRRDSVEGVRRAFEQALASLSSQYINPSLPIKLLLIYKMARMIEKGQLSEGDLPLSIPSMYRKTMEYLKKMRVPNRVEQMVITEAVQIVRLFFQKQGWLFRDFSENIVFFAPVSGEPRRAAHFTLASTISIPDNLAPNMTQHVVVHEAFHHLGGGFPIEWLNEGMTDYLALKAQMEGNSEISFSSKKDRSVLWNFFKEYVKHGPVSKFLFQKIVRMKPGETWDVYFHLVSLVEYLLDEILPVYGKGAREIFIQAYVSGNWPLVVSLLGEDAIELFEFLDLQYQRVEGPYQRTEVSSGSPLSFLMIGKATLSFMKEIKRKENSLGDLTGYVSRFEGRDTDLLRNLVETLEVYRASLKLDGMSLSDAEFDTLIQDVGHDLAEVRNSGDTILNSDERDQAGPSENNGSNDSQLVLPLWNWVLAGVLRLGGMEKKRAKVKANDILKKRWVRMWVIPGLELLGLPGFAHFLAPVLGVWAIPAGALLFTLLHLIHAPPQPWQEHLKQFLVRFTAATLISSLLPIALASFDPGSLSFFEKFAEYFKGSSGWDQALWAYVGHVIYNSMGLSDPIARSGGPNRDFGDTQEVFIGAGQVAVPDLGQNGNGSDALDFSLTQSLEEGRARNLTPQKVFEENIGVNEEGSPTGEIVQGGHLGLEQGVVVNEDLRGSLGNVKHPARPTDRVVGLYDQSDFSVLPPRKFSQGAQDSMFIDGSNGSAGHNSSSIQGPLYHFGKKGSNILAAAIASNVAHFDAQNRLDLEYPSQEMDQINTLMDQINTLLNGGPITITVKNGQFNVPDSDEKKVLYQLLRIEAGAPQEAEFLKKWAEFIQARAQDLQRRDANLHLETETLQNGAYTFYFGDEEHHKLGVDFSSPYGNCVGDGKFFVNLKHLTNIPQEYRIADWIYGTSHEAMHEISGIGDELHQDLTVQDAHILRTGKVGERGLLLTEAPNQFREAFLKTLTVDSPLVVKVGEKDVRKRRFFVPDRLDELLSLDLRTAKRNRMKSALFKRLKDTRMTLVYSQGKTTISPEGIYFYLLRELVGGEEDEFLELLTDCIGFYLAKISGEEFLELQDSPYTVRLKDVEGENEPLMGRDADGDFINLNALLSLKSNKHRSVILLASLSRAFFIRRVLVESGKLTQLSLKEGSTGSFDWIIQERQYDRIELIEALRSSFNGEMLVELGEKHFKQVERDSVSVQLARSFLTDDTAVGHDALRVVSNEDLIRFLSQVDSVITAFRNMDKTPEEILDLERVILRMERLKWIGQKLFEAQRSEEFGQFFVGSFEKFVGSFQSLLDENNPRELNHMLAMVNLGRCLRYLEEDLNNIRAGFLTIPDRLGRLDGYIKKGSTRAKTSFYLRGLPILLEAGELSREDRGKIDGASDIICKTGWLNQNQDKINIPESLVLLEREREEGYTMKEEVPLFQARSSLGVTSLIITTIASIDSKDCLNKLIPLYHLDKFEGFDSIRIRRIDLDFNLTYIQSKMLALSNEIESFYLDEFDKSRKKIRRVDRLVKKYLSDSEAVQVQAWLAEERARWKDLRQKLKKSLSNKGEQAHFDAQNKPDLKYPENERPQIDALLGNSITMTVTDGQFVIPDSPYPSKKDALYKILGIKAGTDEEREFLKKWAAFIRARAQALRFETETLLDGTYTFYFGDEEHHKLGVDFSSPYGNCVGDGKFFVNLKHLTNILQKYRIADWIYGTSHEAMHEISGIGDELHDKLRVQDAIILMTGGIGEATLTETPSQFEVNFIKTLNPNSYWLRIFPEKKSEITRDSKVRDVVLRIGFSGRVLSALSGLTIETLSDFAQMDESDFKGRNFGVESMNNLKLVLARYGIRLAGQERGRRQTIQRAQGGTARAARSSRIPSRKRSKSRLSKLLEKMRDQNLSSGERNQWGYLDLRNPELDLFEKILKKYPGFPTMNELPPLLRFYRLSWLLLERRNNYGPILTLDHSCLKVRLGSEDFRFDLNPPALALARRGETDKRYLAMALVCQFADHALSRGSDLRPRLIEAMELFHFDAWFRDRNGRYLVYWLENRKSMPEVLRELVKELEVYREEKSLSYDSWKVLLMAVGIFLAEERLGNIQSLASELRMIHGFVQANVLGEVEEIERLAGETFTSGEGIVIHVRTGEARPLGGDEVDIAEHLLVLDSSVKKALTTSDVDASVKVATSGLSAKEKMKWGLGAALSVKRLWDLKGKWRDAIRARVLGLKTPLKFALDVQLLLDPERTPDVLATVRHLRRIGKNIEVRFFDSRGDVNFQELERLYGLNQEHDFWTVNSPDIAGSLVSVMGVKPDEIRVIGTQENWSRYGGALREKGILAVRGGKDFEIEQLVLTILYAGPEDETELRKVMRETLGLSEEEIEELLPGHNPIPPAHPLRAERRALKDIEDHAHATVLLEHSM
ncbi:MAG: phosphodiester glycosidase family protein, partial [Chlamydiae bacterium]|nr:phosphodiester glycosidase family protein [Chlamydiota bacterium]MBI3277898.1 phosphodiester glycosidase family protein [Chlamydiota bacterium]